MQSTVLFVEDDPIDQKAIEREIQENGWPIRGRFAHSVREAKAILNSQKFDAAVVDFMLKDGTGFDVFNELDGTPIVVITGSGNEEIAVEAMKSGAVDYLVKEPSRNYLKILPTVIDSALRNKELENRVKMLSRAMEEIKESVYITDLDTSIIYVNRAFQKSYGYREQEILGRPASILYGKLTEMAAVLPTYIQDEGTLDAVHKRKNGNAFPAAISRTAVKDDDGGDVSIIHVVRDMTERQRMEDALLSAIDKYSRLLEMTQKDGIKKDIRKAALELKKAYEILMKAAQEGL